MTIPERRHPLQAEQNVILQSFGPFLGDLLWQNCVAVAVEQLSAWSWAEQSEDVDLGWQAPQLPSPSLASSIFARIYFHGK